jgi:hypothetical protein
MPATSMLSFTANGMPQSGFDLGSKAPSALAWVSSAALSAMWMKIPGSSAAAMRSNAAPMTSAGVRPWA